MTAINILQYDSIPHILLANISTYVKFVKRHGRHKGMKKYSLVFDSYCGEWVLIDRSVWYKTKYLTYQTHSEALSKYNQCIQRTPDKTLGASDVSVSAEGNRGNK